MQLNPIKNTDIRSVRMDLAEYNKQRTLGPLGLERQLREAGLGDDCEIVIFERCAQDLTFTRNLL